MKDRRDPMKVFLPSVALESETCLLLGIRNATATSCCITNYILLHKVTVNELNRTLRLCPDINVIGLLINGQSDYDRENIEVWKAYVTSYPEHIILMNINRELPTCVLHNSNSVIPTTILLFSANDLDASCLLECQDPCTNIGQVYASWQNGLEFQKMCDEKGFKFVQGFSSLDSNWLHYWLQECLLKIYLVLSFVTSFLYNNGIFNLCWNCHYLPKSAVICQLQKKSRMLHKSIIHHNDSKLDKIRLTGVLWQQVFDVILGIGAMYLLSCHYQTIGSLIMDWTKVVAAELEQLLKWMMGVPAGLKLNKELAHFLGQFFIYHVYLWKGYLSFLYPIWTDVVWLISVSGCLGLTLQLSIIQDVFSLMTLHFYCFYVYAARLYSLQMYALQSLWRLFRGKKWNPLFQRVDSSSYDVDQLFIGTLLFTILLFLLPTTGLFYAVFTILRLLVLAIHGSLYKLVAIIDYVSVYAVYLRFVMPNKIAANVELHVQPRKAHQPLYHHLQLHPVSLLRLFQLLNISAVYKDKVADTWPIFLEKLIKGKLIYPWIE